MATKRTHEEMMENQKPKRFKFTNEMIANLIDCLINYKTLCEYENIDFDADKPKQYSCIRMEMAKIYYDVEVEYFGPVESIDVSLTINPDIKKSLAAEKKLIDRGYQRILEKIKDIRQKFSKAVISGTRSGSGKIIFPHYDKLLQIWGGSPNIQPSLSGVDTSAVNSTHDIEYSNQNFNEDSFNTATETLDRADDDVIKLIDNKRHHLERRLSAAQRDELMIKEAREERLQRKEMQEMVKTSNESIADAMKNISKSMLEISGALTRSVEFMINEQRTIPMTHFRHAQQPPQQQQQPLSYQQLLSMSNKPEHQQLF